MPKYISGRSRVTSQSQLQSDRYKYLSIGDAEPNLGDPLVGPSSIGAKPIIPGQQYIVVSVEGSPAGERYWIPNQGGIIPGSISVFDDGSLVGTLSSITQLNFVGAAVSASVSIASSNLATIRVFSPGNNQEILFNTANEFSTSSKLKFDSSIGLLSAGDRITVGPGGTVITTTGAGYVGIGTTTPTQELHLQGNLRISGTFYDSINQPGNTGDLIVKTADGGILWVDPGTVLSGAGGTIGQIQFHNAAGLVDGANNFYYDFNNNRIGIGSTQPKVLLDVLGISSFKGGSTIDNLNVTGVTTTSTLAVSGNSTTRNLLVTGVSTIGFVTGTNAFFTGIVTASKLVGELNVTQLYVTGISTLLQKVNVNSDLGVTGLTTTQNLQVYQSTTLNRLNVTGVSTFTSQLNVNNLSVTGVGTFDNIKLDTNTVSTNTGNLIIDSNAGTTQINDSLYVNDTTESTSKDSGSILTEGGVGIEKNLNVGGSLKILGTTTLAENGGITTTGGDLYVGGNLYLSQDIFQDEIFARNGFFTGITSTKDLLVTGIATIATLGVSGLTTTRNLRVIGVSTFDGLLDANAGATIDNIQIGISGDNEIDTSSGNLTIDSFSGTTIIDDQLSVTGISTFSSNAVFNSNVTLGDANTDRVNFISRVGTGITPSATDTHDLGSSSPNLRWNNVYAKTFVGAIIGNADSASQVSSGTTTGTSSYFLTFVDSNNGTRSNEFLYTDAGVTYNPSTDTLTPTNLTVSGISTFNGNSTFNSVATFNDNVTLGDANTDRVNFISRVGTGITPSATDTHDLGSSSLRWKSIYAKEFIGEFVGIASTAKQLETARDFSINGTSSLLNAGDVSASAVSFNGTQNVVLNGSLKNVTGLSAGTYGNSVTVPIVSVNSQGIVTSITSVGVNFSTATVANADNIAVVTRGTNATHYLTFVDSDNSPAASYESIYTDAGVTYNPSTNLLTSGNLIITGVSTFQGNVTIGDSSTDKVSFAATVDSNIIPNGGVPRDLGSPNNKWNTVYANTIVGAVTGNADSATRLATPRDFSIDGNNNTTNNAGDVSAATTSFDGTANVILRGSLKNVTGLSAGTYGNSVTVPIVSVNSQGIVTSITSVGVNFSTATVGQSDAVKTVSTATNATHYLTFVDSNNSPATYESVYTDTGVTYNPSSDLLSATNLTVTGITTLGDSTTDRVTFNAKIDSSVLPSTDGTLDLGGSSNKWNNVYANNFVGSIIGNADSATRANYADNAGISTNLKGGSTGSIPYQSSANTTTFLTDPNVNGRIITWNDTTNAPVWSDPTNLTFGTANYAIRAGLATDVEINGTNQLLYQSSNNNTDVLPQGTLGQLLQSNGTSAPSWVNPTELTVSRASYADNAGISTNLKGGIASQIPYQTAANTTAFIPNGTAGQLLQSNGTSAPSWVSATNLTAGSLDGGTLKNYAEVIYAFGNTGTSATLSLSNGNFVTATLTGNCTFAFNLTGCPAGAFAFTLFLRNDATAGRSIVWPPSVRWPNGVAPSRTTTANRADVYTFFTFDGGSSWYGILSIYNYA